MTTTVKMLLFVAAISGVSLMGAVAQTPAPAPAPSTTNVPNLGTPSPVTNQAQSGTPVQPGANGVFTVRTSSRLVVLDVVVADKKRNLVTNLKREDFSVTEAKEAQTILNFEVPGKQAVEPEATINSTADLDRLAPRAPVNIILLDEFNTRFEDMAFARYALKKFLEKQPDKLTTPTMLVSVDLQHFTVLKDYTQDRQAVLDALNHHFVAYPWQTRGTSWMPERVSTAFGTLMRVAEATVGHPGHKNMIWIGRGFPALNFVNLQVDAQTGSIMRCRSA